MADLFGRELEEIANTISKLNVLSANRDHIALSDIQVYDSNGEVVGVLHEVNKNWQFTPQDDEEPTPADKLIELFNDQLRQHAAGTPGFPLNYMAHGIGGMQITMTRGMHGGEEVNGQLELNFRRVEV